MQIKSNIPFIFLNKMAATVNIKFKMHINHRGKHITTMFISNTIKLCFINL